MTTQTAVVTGASSGIGEATARRLVAEGFEVYAAARRRDRLDKLAAEVDVHPVTLDVTSEDSVAELADLVGEVDVLINNAGGAHGLDPIAKADFDDWRVMYESNVLGAVRVTKALLPALVAGAGGQVVMVTSIAGHVAYENGAGYNAAKFAQVAATQALRLELNGWPVRVTEIAPGMVRTDEFSLVRFKGDTGRADAVYDDVVGPLTADDVADAIAWAVTRPPHVNVDQVVLKPLAQAAPHKLHKGEFRSAPVA